MYYPYYSGDVLWYLNFPGTHINPVIQVQDTAGAYQNWLLQAIPDYIASDGQTIQQIASEDRLPVFMLPQPGYSIPLSSNTSTHAAYTYLSAVRPGVSVRQYIQGRDDGGLSLYWTPDDPNNEQIGAGAGGEMPGDYLFLFGGAVVRDTETGMRDTAIYASVGIVIDDDASPLGARVYPPYRGQSGGPDGGPLLTVLEQPLDMFFHPTGAQPGQVFTVGDKLVIAGQVAPALNSNVYVTITDPAGQAYTSEGIANAIGYFYDPSDNLTLDTPGVWTVNISVQHTGLTSAGLVEPPLPHGNVLGAEGGSFPIYVVPPESESLNWNDTRQDFAIPGAIPYNFNFTLPAGWTGVQASHVITIPGYIVSAGPINVPGQTFSYQYNPTNLGEDFPNIETDARLKGPAASDSLTLTFAATGIDDSGEFQIRTRTFTIMHDRLMTLE
jgi:hypothetical protein